MQCDMSKERSDPEVLTDHVGREAILTMTLRSFRSV